MGLGMLASIFTDLENWIRSWDSTTFAVVLIVFLGLMTMFGTDFLKGLLGGKTKFKFFSFLFLALSTTALVYICIKY